LFGVKLPFHTLLCCSECQYVAPLSGTVAFIGSHLDVVPANPETWERNPFKLCVEVGEDGAT